MGWRCSRAAAIRHAAALPRGERGGQVHIVSRSRPNDVRLLVAEPLVPVSAPSDLDQPMCAGPRSLRAASVLAPRSTEPPASSDRHPLHRARREGSQDGILGHGRLRVFDASLPRRGALAAASRRPAGVGYAAPKPHSPAHQAPSEIMCGRPEPHSIPARQNARADSQPPLSGTAW